MGNSLKINSLQLNENEIWIDTHSMGIEQREINSVYLDDISTKGVMLFIINRLILNNTAP